MIQTLGQIGSESGEYGFYFVLAAVALLSFWMMMSIRRKVSRRQTEDLTPHEKVERIRQVGGVRDDMRDMMVELNDLTRRFGSQLDAKSMRLEKLLDEADQRIAELQQLQGGTVSPSDPTPETTAGRLNLTETRPQIEALAPDPEAERVYRLADEGLSTVEIAQQLDGQVGKVELILALRREGA